MLKAVTALTIAGFDPSSGAGVTADLQVFAAHRVFGTSAITALTVQTTQGVRRVEAVDAAILSETLYALDDDLPPDGIKIGMLRGEAQVRQVIRYVEGLSDRHVVLDPVLRSSSGATLLDDAGLELLQSGLLPLVDIVTPNIAELSVLAKQPCETLSEQRRAAEQLARTYGCAVVVTGGDRSKPDDLVLYEGAWTTLPGEHIATAATHGTGCAFSSALLCGLLHRKAIPEAASEAKLYVAEAMRSAVTRGQGRGPMNLLWPLLRQQSDS